ncbi:cytochrome c biogenesis CcdA family protein [soil metagenome]
MSLASLGLAFVAGLLTLLSPCVLPLLPLVLGAATGTHSFAAPALAAGIAISFTVLGLFVATIGFAVGLDADFFRWLAALLFIGLGAVLILPSMEARLAFAGGPLADWGERRLGAAADARGPFTLGLLLGVVWVPCVGPTIGAASLLAARGEQLGAVAITMLVFGIGAAIPLVGIGLLSRRVLLAWRARLGNLGRGLHMALGVLLILVGALIFTGYDHTLETVLVNASPDWLTELTTRY